MGTVIEKQTQGKALRPFNGLNIPDALKANDRWAPWKAVWSEKRQKYDKIPHLCTAPHYGISTAKPDRWGSYDAALKAYLENPTVFAGVGYVMTGQHDVVGVDLDHCVSDNTIAPWALDVIAQLDSYTELSPSGNGLRIWVHGEVPNDWTNHEVGIEVYGGHEPRFLTATGQRLKMSGHELTRPLQAALTSLSDQYAKTRTKAEAVSLTMPDILDEMVLPDVATLGLRYAEREFLTTGETDGDRSRALHAAGVALYASGLTDEEVFSMLALNPFAMEVALDHRRQDSDRALMYLWVEHCQKAKPKAASKVASIDDFDDESKTPLAPVDKAHEAINSIAIKPMRFAFTQAADYLKRKPLTWLIKNVLPHGDVGAVFGESGAGKSFFALDLVMAVAAGKPWKGHQVSQGTVAYVCAEGAGGFTVRLKAYGDHHGLDLARLPFHILGDAPNFLEKTDIKDLRAALRSLPDLNVIVVDTLAQVTAGGNENSGEDMGRALAHCKLLAQATGAMVLLVAHSGKDSARGLRGWSGIKGALDVEILVEKAGKQHCATITKMKDGEGEGKEFAFGLTSVTVGLDEDGGDITSCVIHHEEKRSKSQLRRAPKGDVEKIVMRIAVALTDLPGPVTLPQLTAAAINEIPKPEGKRDQRVSSVDRAVCSLAANSWLSTTGGEVQVL